MTKTPIYFEDIRKGDTIRLEAGDSSLSPAALEYVARKDGDKWTMYLGDEALGNYFLLDRPKKLVYASGTTLYLKDGDHRSIVLSRGHFEGDKWLCGQFGLEYRADFYTDVKPDPHPVGAVRWVTQDTKSPYGHPFEKGERVTVTGYRSEIQLGTITVRAPADQLEYFINPAFLSATRVDPEAVSVTVPRDAVEKLRAAQIRAANAGSGVAVRRSIIRSAAIVDFLEVVDGRD